MSSRMLAGLCLVLATSCKPSTPTMDAATDASRDEYTRPPTPDGSILIETPDFVIPGGSEKLWCTYSPIVLDHDIYTRELHSYQLRGGHHVALFYSTDPNRGSFSRECTEEDMTGWNMVGAGAESNELGLNLPPGVGVRIPAGARLVLQSHYVNAELQDRTMKDALVLVPSPRSALTTIADAFAVSDGDLMIPPRTAYSRTLECTMDAETNVLLFLGHTHEWGTQFRAWVQRAANNNTLDPIYSEVAGVRLMNSPVVHNYEPNLQLAAGDKIRVRCDWNNTTDQLLGFPKEMCVGFGFYYPARGFFTCGNVIETTGGADAGVDGGDAAVGNQGCSTAPGPSDPCVRTCNTGNEIGIGKYCTAGGRQCVGNRSAILCTRDFDQTSTVGFCTKPCVDDRGCGSGSVCTGDARGKGCVPIECAPPSDTDAGADATVDASSSDAGIDASTSD